MSRDICPGCPEPDTSRSARVMSQDIVDGPDLCGSGCCVLGVRRFGRRARGEVAAWMTRTSRSAMSVTMRVPVWRRPMAMLRRRPGSHRPRLVWFVAPVKLSSWRPCQSSSMRHRRSRPWRPDCGPDSSRLTAAAGADRSAHLLHRLPGNSSSRRRASPPPVLSDPRRRPPFRRNPASVAKGWDLRRDPRCVIHATPGPDDAELCIRATAADVTAHIDTTSLVRSVVERSGVGGMIESVRHEPVFEFDLHQVDVAHWVNVGQPGTHAVRHQWRQDAT